MCPRLGDLSRRYTLTPVPCPSVCSIGDGGILMGVLLFCTFSMCRLRSLRRGVSILRLLSFVTGFVERNQQKLLNGITVFDITKVTRKKTPFN